MLEINNNIGWGNKKLGTQHAVPVQGYRLRFFSCLIEFEFPRQGRFFIFFFPLVPTTRAHRVIRNDIIHARIPATCKTHFLS